MGSSNSKSARAQRGLINRSDLVNRKGLDKSFSDLKIADSDVDSDNEGISRSSLLF